ncbi:hypothetical protein QCA50_006422 [Cerrena zonata]|uniref:Uncharacterized protein n=1 Tax=Cerrena zonata TaxID=2478898 RepID=A0AAW0G827_9APHY
MEIMSAPAQTRHTPFLQERHVPSMPIPIPSRRNVTDPPPSSPVRTDSSTDLLFEMSPTSPEDAPLSQYPSLRHVSGNLCHRRVNTLISRPVEKDDDSSENRIPYGHEPFLYSVPRIPLRLSNLHSRPQSQAFNRLQPSSMSPTDPEAFRPYQPHHTSVPSTAYSSPSTSVSVGQSVPRFDEKASVHLDDRNILTSAFQNSVISSGYPSPSSLTESEHVPSKVSSATSLKKLQQSVRSKRGSPVRQRKSIGAYPHSFLRTTAAAPVISFAHAELDDLPSSYGKDTTRSTKVKYKTPPGGVRAKSPYHVVRGRKNSYLQERNLRLSDEELSGTLKYDEVNFGLEKFLPAFSRRKVKNENVESRLLVEEKERGRTRSRVRGRRA